MLRAVGAYPPQRAGSAHQKVSYINSNLRRHNGIAEMPYNGFNTRSATNSRSRAHSREPGHATARLVTRVTYTSTAYRSQLPTVIPRVNTVHSYLARSHPKVPAARDRVWRRQLGLAQAPRRGRRALQHRTTARTRGTAAAAAGRLGEAAGRGLDALLSEAAAGHAEQQQPLRRAPQLLLRLLVLGRALREE